MMNPAVVSFTPVVQTFPSSFNTKMWPKVRVMTRPTTNFFVFVLFSSGCQREIEVVAPEVSDEDKLSDWLIFTRSYSDWLIGYYFKRMERYGPYHTQSKYPHEVSGFILLVENKNTRIWMTYLTRTGSDPTFSGPPTPTITVTSNHE